MRQGSRGASAVWLGMLAALEIGCGVGAALAGDANRQTQPLPGLRAGGKLAVETVYFADPRQAPVALVRGAHAAPPPLPARPPPPAPPQRVEILSFGTGFADRVKVIRGGALILASLGGQAGIEKVSFGDPRVPAVSVVRGAAIRELFSVDLFGPANGGELDRIAFAVEGVESRHGADPAMWRQSWTAAQGPMQITAAAAFDVGGGDRFDIYQNRQLGRAYLAQMFQRYGNWQDALAAYNWGPGNMDLWIAGGRNTDVMPPGVAYYVARVLRDALITAAAAAGL